MFMSYTPLQTIFRGMATIINRLNYFIIIIPYNIIVHHHNDRMRV